MSNAGPSDINQRPKDQNEVYRNIFRGSLERKSEHIKQDAVSIARYVRLLKDTPGYVDDVETILKATDLALVEARLVIRLALAELASVPEEPSLQAAE